MMLEPLAPVETLHLNDLFWTVQGEGFNAGRRALFVRMPFCDLKCSWCDTEFNSYKEHTVKTFEQKAVEEKARFAVLTGGEPSMHKHTPRVIEILKSLGFFIAMETNGHFPIPKDVDWVTVSPKRDTAKMSQSPWFVCSGAWKAASEFKYIVDKTFDFRVLDRHFDEVITHKHYLSPEYTDFKENVELILSYIKKNPNWRISLQTHKWMEIA